MRQCMRYCLVCGCLLGVSYASGSVDISHTDFSERIINFVIFLAVLWYLGAHRLKLLLQSRQRTISSRFEQVQDRLNDAKKNKEQMKKQLEEAQKKAIDIIATAKKEAIAIAQKYEEQCSVDIDNLIKSSNLMILFEQRKARMELVESVLKELFSNGMANIDTQEYVRILSKKVI